MARVVVIGAGQAGLATSFCLTKAGVEHVVLERSRIASAWRERWNSFCLVSPNWSVQLPGGAYDGDDPDGFMRRDQLVAYFERYASGFAAPVREGVRVRSLLPLPGGGFRLNTADGALTATEVVVATGAYQRPFRPAAAQAIPRDVVQLDVGDYRAPDQLSAGTVLVVGSGQSGCQIAEELCDAGRDVFLACGRANWAPRCIEDRDLFWWLREVGDLDDTLDTLPDKDARRTANIQATGRDGGHDLHYRTLQALGVTLLGHLTDVDGHRARFADDLAATVAWGDHHHTAFMNRIHTTAHRLGLPPPDLPPPATFSSRARTTLDLRHVAAVIFAGGFRPDYRSWIHAPGAFDAHGFPLHLDGTSTIIPGLHFVGVHFLRKRRSALLIGVGDDAAIVATHITTTTRRPATTV